MFRLTREKYMAALESAEAMQKALETEMENLENSSNTLSFSWLGLQSDKSLGMMNESLNEGNHSKALAYTKGMTEIMGEYLPEIEKMMAKREQIGKQLTQDEYYTPDLTSFQETDLAVNYEYIDDVKADAEGAVLYGEAAAGILEEMITEVEACAGEYTDLTKVKDLLEEGRKKLQRITNYRDEFEDFGKKMSDMEYNMSMDLANVMEAQEGILSPDAPRGMAVVDFKERTEQMEKADMETMLRERGLTEEQYTSALLDCFMYLDFFDDDEDNEYRFVDIKGKIYDGMTVNELLELLEGYDLYTEGAEDGKSTRYIFYQILGDAIELNPDLGKYEISHMSRRLKATETGMEYNEGTNGIVFTNPVTNEIYVAYRGTSMGEWGDDGERFNCRNVNDLTPQMEQTLHYFNYVAESMGWTDDMEIYVTGHSQGGNDAQISILLSEYGKYVDACYSFDGEGHSPELLKDLEAVLGEAEYNSRVGRMYSICGEYDFVNHLGEKVIPEENTIYIKCNIEDFAKMHDIVSMFCDEDMNYNGMINTGTGTGPSVVTILTAEAWEELYELPPKARASCQATIMNTLEGLLSGGECWKGLNGEQATLGDIAGTILYGPEWIGDSVYDTAKHYTVSGVENVLKRAVDHGMSETQAAAAYTGVRILAGVNEFVTDCKQNVNNAMNRPIHEPIKFMEEKVPEMINAIEEVAGAGFEQVMQDETLRNLVLPPIAPLPIGPVNPF